MVRAALAAALLLAAALPSRATDCDAGGQRRTEEICSNPARVLRCSKRIAHMRRECQAREQELQREGNDKSRAAAIKKEMMEMRSALATVERYDAQTPDYKSPEYLKLEAQQAKGGGRERGPGGSGGGAYPGADGGEGEGGEEGQGEEGGAVGEAAQAMRGGDYPGAEAAATSAIAQNPENPAAWMARAQARALQGNAAGARADARQVLGLNPSPKQAAAADIIIGRGDSLAAGASKVASKKLDMQKRALQALSGGVDGLAGSGGGGSGRASRTAGEAPGGAGALSGGQGLSPAAAAAAASALPAASGLKNEAADRAYAKLRVRDYSGAKEDASRAILERPDDPRAHTLRAAANNRLGLHEEAVADADAALAIKPKDVTALLERGYAKYKLGRYADALEDVDSALIEDPLNAMGYLYRGMILEKLNRVSDAVSAYVKAGELDPALSPVAEEAKARLGAAGNAPAQAASLPRRLASRWKLWLGLLVVAGLLVARGARRAVKAEWATPMTPMR